MKKCPYCDFNSHAEALPLPELQYVEALRLDLANELSKVQGRELISIFFGGGTPSLFSCASVANIIENVRAVIPFCSDIEITLEANPGTVEAQKFDEFRAAGINRLSIGIQSFDDDKLTSLGRIHDGKQARNAIEMAKNAGFDNFNVDLMHGLPGQTVGEALNDISQALDAGVGHLSWYQLTIEPNTYFHRFPPVLPDEDCLDRIYDEGSALIESVLPQYEVSAFARKNRHCVHNGNYWEFGDYIGIGAGAHSKLTEQAQGITRHWKLRQPSEYLRQPTKLAGSRVLSAEDLAQEFMMNVLRLKDGVPLEFFESRTRLPLSVIDGFVTRAVHRELLQVDARIGPTSLGLRFLNDLLAIV